MKKVLLLLAILAAGTTALAQQPVTIACIGDSVMFGNGLPSRERNNFPAQLQNMLGKGYTVSMTGDANQASRQHAHIVILCFADDALYQKAISGYPASRLSPRFIIALPPALPGSDLAERERRMAKVRTLAMERNCQIVDLAPVVAAKGENFQDAAHLSSLGHTDIARRLYEAVKFKAAEWDVARKLKGEVGRQFTGFKVLDIDKKTSIIRPHQTAKGAPWAWVTGSETDTLTVLGMLERGFHIVIANDMSSGVKLQLRKAGLTAVPVMWTDNNWHYAGHKITDARPVPAILRACKLLPNFAAIAAPGSEYRSGAGWNPGKDWWGQHENIDSLLRAPGKMDVVFLGNSITQGTGGHRTAVTYKAGFAAFDAAFGMYRWESAGISGDRTQNVLWRLQNGAYREAAPRLIVLTIGVNNFPDNEPEEVAAGIREILTWIEKNMPATKVLLIGPLPAGNKPGEMRRVKYEKTQAIISSFAVRGRYLPLAGTFILPDGSLDPQLCSPDGIHLQEAGYHAWAKALKPVVDEMLR